MIMSDTQEKIVFDISALENTIEARTFNRFENGRMTTYSYSIERNKYGVVVSQTEPMAIGSIGWDDGTPFTEEDCFRVKNGLPMKAKKRGFFSRLFDYVNG